MNRSGDIQGTERKVIQFEPRPLSVDESLEPVVDSKVYDFNTLKKSRRRRIKGSSGYKHTPESMTTAERRQRFHGVITAIALAGAFSALVYCGAQAYKEVTKTPNIKQPGQTKPYKPPTAKVK